jgi:hypothetical protein
VEDLIGFKVQAMANNDSRMAVDLADIEALMAFNKQGLNWDLVSEYFDLFGFGELLARLRVKYSDA